MTAVMLSFRSALSRHTSLSGILRGASALRKSRIVREDSERAEDFNRERERRRRSCRWHGNDRASSEKFGQWRIRCPMLEDDRRCAIYQNAAADLQGHTVCLCRSTAGAMSAAFPVLPGDRDYPTIKMDNIHRYLLDLSRNLVEIKELRPDSATEKEFPGRASSLRLAAGWRSDSGR